MCNVSASRLYAIGGGVPCGVVLYFIKELKWVKAPHQGSFCASWTEAWDWDDFHPSFYPASLQHTYHGFAAPPFNRDERLLSLKPIKKRDFLLLTNHRQGDDSSSILVATADCSWFDHLTQNLNLFKGDLYFLQPKHNNKNLIWLLFLVFFGSQ